MDAAGAPFALPEAGSARACTPVERDGRPVAMLVHDAAVADERELVTAVGGAAALALENERLDAELRANLKELRASRARIVESADAARRRIERDLHDGAQQQLVALALRLGAARSRVERDPRGAAELLDDAATDLDAAIRDLRELARGIHPAVLSDRGLGPALEALASRIPLPVEITALPGERLPRADRGGRVLRRRRGDHQRRALRERHARGGGRSHARTATCACAWPTTASAGPTPPPALGCAASPIAWRRSTGGSRSPRLRVRGRRSAHSSRHDVRVDVGIGLPNAVRDVDRAGIVEWAQRAEAAGFSSLGTIDRIVYSNYESLIALAAAAAVTERIRLVTDILIAPLRTNTALFAKQAATIDSLSGGRLELGLAVGGRDDDFAVSGVDFHRRGRIFDTQLEELTRLWSGERGVGPAPVNGRPGLLIGGSSEVAYRRAAQHADGWTAGGGGAERFAEGRELARQAWRDAGRDGEPRTMALAYFSLGPDAEAVANANLGHYYAFAGEYAAMIAGGAAKTPQAVRDLIASYEQAGADEIICFPASADPAQVDLLAEAIGPQTV